MLDVHHMIGVVDHPRWVFGADDLIEVQQIKTGKLLVAGNDFGGIALRTGQLDQVGLNVIDMIESCKQSCPQVFRAADDKRHRAGRDDGEFHGYPIAACLLFDCNNCKISRPIKILIEPVYYVACAFYFFNIMIRI